MAARSDADAAPHPLGRPEIVLGFVTLVVVVAALPSLRAIPGGWASSFGLDLGHVQAFHTCARRDAAYLASGAECGDRLVPYLQYPPLLYWFFVWTRVVPLSVGRWLWASFIALALLGLARWWTRPASGEPPRARAAIAVVGAVLLAGFPALFAMERGNNDILVVLLWTLSFRLFQARRPLASGGAAGVAIALKLYPLFAAIVVAAGLLGAAKSRERRREALRFGAGLLLALVMVGFAFFEETRQYLTLRLPQMIAHLPEVSSYSHSVPATFGGARYISGGLLCVWSAVSFVSFARRPREVFAGALAISTYFAATSYDYNLITVYPLLLVVLARAVARRRPIDWWSASVFVVGLVTIVAHWLDRVPRAQIALQLDWLLVAAAWVFLRARMRERSSHDELPVAS